MVACVTHKALAAAQLRLTPLTLMVSKDTPLAVAKRRRQGPILKIIKNTPIALAKRQLVHTTLKIITLLRPFQGRNKVYNRKDDYPSSNFHRKTVASSFNFFKNHPFSNCRQNGRQLEDG